jgi:hypothetical protein
VTTLSVNRICVVHFEPGFNLTMTRSGSGTGTVTSTPAGINCGADCSEGYASGTVVTLIATPGAGSAFAGFGGEADCVDGSVTIGQDVSCVATFEQTFQLTVSRTGTGLGSVTSTPAGISCGGDCSELYGAGTVVSLLPAPARENRLRRV